MKHRITACILSVVCLLSFTGCWDYRGMDEINIVAGIAVDKYEDQYQMTLELVNVASMKESQGERSIYVTSKGPTVFEAVRNAKKKLFNKLYFGSARIVVISQKLAREEGILNAIDSFTRDGEPRENIFLCISQEPTAGELLTSEGLDISNVSYEMAHIIHEDHKVDASSKGVRMYQAYDTMHSQGQSLVLPAFRLVDSDEEGPQKIVEINGIAMFKKDKLVGYLGPEETHSFLMLTDKNTLGPISFPFDEGDDKSQVAIELHKCTNQVEVRVQDGRVKISAKVNFEFGVIELHNNVITTTADDLTRLQERAKEVVEERISTMFRHVQQEYGCDIFGYGKKLYENDLKLWRQIENDWEALFKEAEFQVEVSTKVIDTGFLTK